MAAMARFGRRALVVTTGLFMIGIVIQFLTAGFGIFEATSFDLHQDLGSTIVHLLAILIFASALLGRVPRPDLGRASLVAVLATVQVYLPTFDSGWIAGLHPFNALVLFLISNELLGRSRPYLAPAQLPAG